MLVFGLWCLVAWFIVNLVGGVVGAGVKIGKNSKDSKAEGCVQAFVYPILYGFGIWILIAAIFALR